MAKSELIIPSNFPEGFENHNWKNTNTNFDELYAKIAALEEKVATLERSSSSLTSANKALSIVTPVGPTTTSSPFVTGPSSQGYQIIDWDAKTLVSTVPGPIEIGGGTTYTYSDGTKRFVPYPDAVINPPLAAFSELPRAQRLSLISQYAEDKNIFGMTNAGPEYINSYDSPVFRQFLESRGITTPTGISVPD